MFGENKIALDDGSGLQKSFLNMSYVKKAPGPPAQEIIDQENESLRRDRQNLIEAKKQLKQAETLITEKKKKKEKEMQEVRKKIDRTQAQIDAIQDEHGTNIEMQSEIDRLKTVKNNYQNTYEKLKTDVAELEKQVKTKKKPKQSSTDSAKKLQRKKETEMSWKKG